MSIAPTGVVLGAEIRGVDLSRDLDAATFSRIEEAFNQRNRAGSTFPEM